MAVQRPNVIVFQEYAEVNVVPDIPDLNVLIVGPCNQLLDYIDDKSECYAGDYGEEGVNSPVGSVDSVILSPPNIAAGGVLDADSAKVFFDEATVEIVKHSGSTTEDAQYSSGSNLFKAYGATGGADFGTIGVAAGDKLYTNSPGTDDYVKTVKQVVTIMSDIATTVDFITAGVEPGDLAIIVNDIPPGGAARNGVYTVLRVPNAYTLEFLYTGWTQNPSSTFGGSDTLQLTVTSPTGAVKFAAATDEYSNYSYLEVTSDFAANAPASAEWRVERTVNDLELDATDITVSGNQITVAADITVDLSSTLTGLPVTYAKIYMEYAALRTDLQRLNTVTSDSEMQALMGKYDSRNPLYVGAVVAKANTNTPVQVFGVSDDSLTGYLDFIDKISSEKDVYAIVPLTYNTSVLGALNSMTAALSDPNYALTQGIKQKFRSVIGAVELQTEKDIITAAAGVTTSQESGTAVAANTPVTLALTGGTLDNLSTLGVIPGTIVRMTDDSTSTTTEYVVSQLVDTDAVIFDTPPTANVDLDGVNDTMVIITPDGTETTYTCDGSTITNLLLTLGSPQTLYLNVHVTGGSFLTSGVIPGDLFQMPTSLLTNSWTTYNSWVIEEVISDERIRIINNGKNTSTLANELPYAYSREDASAIVQGAMYYRVIRNLTKEEQVDAMVAVANSFSSKRLVLCYPDEVEVTDLVDGSKTRSDGVTPESADLQPGYYLACVVGGQTAGLPPQQGFTNFGGSGISRIYGSQDYFKEEQLTELSNGGVYVFVQDNAGSVPYSIHEVTTDISTLEFSEYMVTKNFDFVAWTFLDTVQGFIGTWNVIPETIEFIRQACYSTGNTLKARYVAKIGSPLTDFTVDSVDVSDLSRDRVEAYLTVDLPMALNTIGIHLVA